MRVCPKKLICKNDDMWSLLSKVDVTLYPSSNRAKKGSVARDDVPRSRGFGPLNFSRKHIHCIVRREDARLVVVSSVQHIDLAQRYRNLSDAPSYCTVSCYNPLNRENRPIHSSSACPTALPSFKPNLRFLLGRPSPSLTYSRLAFSLNLSTSCPANSSSAAHSSTKCRPSKCVCFKASMAASASVRVVKSKKANPRPPELCFFGILHDFRLP